MGNYKQLKAAIAAVIKANGMQEITGDVLQATLLSLVSNIGDNATFAGMATPNTNPGTPDQNIFYLAAKPGVYSNFGGVELTDQVLIFTNKNGIWVKNESGIATSGKVTKLEGGNIQRMNWKNSFASTVLQVPASYREKGLIVSYTDIEGNYVLKQYTEDVYADNTYTQEKYWQNLLTTKDYNTLLAKIEKAKFIIDESTALDTIDTILPQSLQYDYPFERYKDGKVYRTYNASNVTDTAKLSSSIAHDIDSCTIVMRARSSKGNVFNAVFKIDGVNQNNTIEITPEWKTYVYSVTDISTSKRINITPKDDIDIMSIFMFKGIIDSYNFDDENIERLAFTRYEAKKNRLYSTLNLYKENIALGQFGNWDSKSVSSNLIRIAEVITIIHKPIILGGNQKILCFDDTLNFISTYNARNYSYSQLFKKELPENTEYVSIVTNNFPTPGDSENMFVCEGLFPFIENKGAYKYTENNQSIKTLVTVGKNIITDIERNTTHPQVISGQTYMISITSKIKDTTAFIPVDENENSISVSGLLDNVTGAEVFFYNSAMTQILSSTRLVQTNSEYKGSVTIPSGTGMFVVEIKHKEGMSIDYSLFQIEFGSKITSYEKPIFGINEINSYPLKTNTKRTSNFAINLEDLIVFIFGDSITATNTQASLEGDPDSYPNNILSISWVPDTMVKLGITKWYNFALGGAVWTDNKDVPNETSFLQMSVQVNKAIQFSQEKNVVPDLVIVAMGANNAYKGDAVTDFDTVMHKEDDAQYGYEGIPYEELDRTKLAQAIRWNLHTLEKYFPSAVKMYLTPPQSANRDYITDEGNNDKIKLMELFANAYCFEVIPQYKEAGIVRQFETTGKVEDVWQNTRDLADQVHPNADGRVKIVRYLTNKIASRFLIR
jgi:lysophospholipase L1-like esterase